MIRRIAVVAAFVLLAPPVRAANKDIERLQFLINNLSGQVGVLKGSADETLRELQRLNQRLAEQNDLLRKAIEEQRTRDEARDSMLRELTDRLARMNERLQASQAQAAAPPPAYSTVPAAPESAGGPAGTSPTSPPATAASAPPPGEELYRQAYADCVARGNYDLGIQGFREYLRHYPATEFSDNAQYWIGDCHFRAQRWELAIEAWDTLVRSYETSDKVPDARVKKGMSLERLGRKRLALDEYRAVVKDYPTSPAARLARERLNP